MRFGARPERLDGSRARAVGALTQPPATTTAILSRLRVIHLLSGSISSVLDIGQYPCLGRLDMVNDARINHGNPLAIAATL